MVIRNKTDMQSIWNGVGLNCLCLQHSGNQGWSRLRIGSSSWDSYSPLVLYFKHSVKLHILYTKMTTFTENERCAALRPCTEKKIQEKLNTASDWLCCTVSWRSMLIHILAIQFKNMSRKLDNSNHFIPSVEPRYWYDSRGSILGKFGLKPWFSVNVVKSWLCTVKHSPPCREWPWPCSLYVISSVSPVRVDYICCSPVKQHKEPQGVTPQVIGHHRRDAANAEMLQSNHYLFDTYFVEIQCKRYHVTLKFRSRNGSMDDNKIKAHITGNGAILPSLSGNLNRCFISSYIFACQKK